MTDLTIPLGDFGQIRVFSYSGPVIDGLNDRTQPALATVFGTSELDADYVDVLDPRDLGGLSLAQYMEQGYGIAPDPVDAAALESLSETVILIMSRATDGKEVSLNFAPELRHVTTCGAPAKMSIPETNPTLSAEGIATPPAKKVPSDAAMSGRIAMIALLVLFALVGVMIWVAS